MPTDRQQQLLAVVMAMPREMVPRYYVHPVLKDQYANVDEVEDDLEELMDAGLVERFHEHDLMPTWIYRPTEAASNI